LYAALRATCEKEVTRSYLVDILLDGLDAWFNNIPLDKSRYPPMYNKLITDQDALGWRQLFQGRMTREWARLQDQHLVQQSAKTYSSSGLLWTTSILTTIWREYFIMWDLRNKVVHGEDSKTRQIACRRQLAIKLRHLHTQRDQTLHTDRDIFIGDDPEALETYIENSNVNHIANWLKLWKPVIIDSVKTAKALAIQSVRPMRDYFASLTAPRASIRPPKPRYDRRFHTIHEATRVKRTNRRRPPPGNHSILAYLARQNKTTQHLQV
jgi:hypothetical protein